MSQKTKVIYKDNESDMIVNLIGKTSNLKNYIFNCLVKNSFKKRYGKFSHNDNDYVLVDDVDISLIGFYDSILTIVVIDSFDFDNIKLLLHTMEITNNIILCINDTINIDYIYNIPIVDMDNNGINKLLKTIDKYNYEFSITPNKIRYNFDIESSIRIIKEYLDNIINYKNNRWLSIELLKNNLIIDLIKEYLNYDISIDNSLIDLINNERNKYIDINNLINDKLINEYNKLLEKCNK